MRQQLLDYMIANGHKFCVYRLNEALFIVENHRMSVELVSDMTRCMRELCQQWDDKKEDCGLKGGKE